MNKSLKIIGGIIISVLLALAAHILYLKSLTPKETYPDDKYLETEPNKTALIIVAHDDDMAGSSGTITKLCKEGWQIREMCFYQQGGLYAAKDSLKNPVRKQCLQRVAAIQGLAGVFPVDFNFRNDMQTEKSYLPMPYEQFAGNFKLDSLKYYIETFISTYNPSVIFSLDDSMGGYGHPDHVIISRLVRQYCTAHRNDRGFSVKKIYQAVFPPSTSEKVLNRLPVYRKAKEVYGIAGMPHPDVQVNIYPYAKYRKACMAAYVTEQNSFKQLWPHYRRYPWWIYFRLFDREFFNVIDIQ